MSENQEIELVDEKPQQQIQISSDASPMVQLAQMMQNGLKLDVDQMGKMMDMSERYEANEARKAYHVAMSAFKKNPPKIIKDKHNSQYDSKYAGLANVTTTINEKLSEHGFSANWKTSQLESGWPEVTCTITHAQGHSESTTMAAPPDTSGSKNPIQQIKSTISYLEQITLLALTGLATEDMGDDGNGAGDNTVFIEPPTEEQWECIDLIIEKLPPDEGVVDRDKLAKWFLATNGSYPSTKLKVGEAAEYVVGKAPGNIYAE